MAEAVGQVYEGEQGLKEMGVDLVPYRSPFLAHSCPTLTAAILPGVSLPHPLAIPSLLHSFVPPPLCSPPIPRHIPAALVRTDTQGTLETCESKRRGVPGVHEWDNWTAQGDELVDNSLVLLTGFYALDDTLVTEPPASMCVSVHFSPNVHNFLPVYSLRGSCATGSTVGFRYLDVFREGERIYPVGPFFHFNAQIGIMHAINFGETICFTRKFSASNFFAFCAQTGVNCFPFVGEFLRFILSTPPSPYDRAHKVRACGGNGVRPDIWGPFEKRFGVRINEGYGSTEGVVGSINVFGKQGAVGFQGRLMRALNPLTPRIVKIDPITEELVRDPKTGFCVECQAGEPGEMIGKIVNENFEGYYGDEKSTNKKFVRDVFEKSDVWWRSGDLLIKDWRGWIYFVDRIGDTFRWKGENVSTTEVRDVLLGFTDLEDANVYGVEIPSLPGTGRAGAAALIFKPHLRGGEPPLYEQDSLRRLSAYVKQELPAYAVPRFLRVYEEEGFGGVTVTFKHRKVELQNAGFDPSKIPERMYFYDERKGYVRLTKELYQGIIGGKARL
ncbi:hypothetical protein HDU93_004072 [Gonapodya sp. JEL0774]|nr:hypothetical protein HDU93_004072 [Gonapodya sp. JEL0774]